MKKENKLAKCLTKFLTVYLPHERNVSPNTIMAYKDSFVSFVTYMRDEKKIKVDKLSLSDLTKDNIIDYLKWMVECKGLGIATRNHRLAAIHSFVSYLQYEQIERLDQWQSVMAIKYMKKDYNVPTHYTKEGIKLLLEQPDQNDNKEFRHLTILALMYDTGCRVQELADLKVDSLCIQSKPYTIRIYGKGRKVRVVPLSENVVAILKNYMDRYDLNDARHLRNTLFYNCFGQKLTRAGITYILKKYADMACAINPGVIPETTSCHQLRHSRAMHLLQSGVNLIWIRDFLGHTSIQTTEVYARTDSKQKREAIEKANADLIPIGGVGEWENNQNLLTWLKHLSKS